MREREIQIGRVYRWYPNGVKASGYKYETVRVIRYGGGGFFSVKGPRRVDVPYNHAKPAEFRSADRQDLQAFIENTPIKGVWHP